MIPTRIFAFLGFETAFYGSLEGRGMKFERRSKIRDDLKERTIEKSTKFCKSKFHVEFYEVCSCFGDTNSVQYGSKNVQLHVKSDYISTVLACAL